MITDGGLFFCEGQVVATTDTSGGDVLFPSTDIIDLKSNDVILSVAPYQMFFNVMFNSAETTGDGQTYKVHLLDSETSSGDNLDSPTASSDGSRLIATLDTDDLPYAKYSINLVDWQAHNRTANDGRAFQRYLRAVLEVGGTGDLACTWTAFIAPQRFDVATISKAIVHQGLDTLEAAADGGFYT